ncbi:MAG: restriction endonuclease subunit S [Selenomonadaceae bacterium]|nr:restriction endonuclease subunit S [Selenomonadaceae bacterium]
MIQRGKRLKTADHIQGDVPYISSSAQSNGVDDFIGNSENVRKFKDCLTIANSGSVGKSFYHSYEFIASDHVTALSAPNLNKYHYLFLSKQLERLQEKYNFNREITDTRIRKEKLMLPVNAAGEPDFDYMAAFIKRLKAAQYRKYLNYIGEEESS